MNNRKIFLLLISLVLFLSGCTKEAWKKVIKSENIRSNMKYYYGGFNNEKHGIIIGYGGIISYTVDAGKTWLKGKNSSWCRFGLDIVDDNFAICTGNKGHNRITNDGGKTWLAVTDYGMMEPNQMRYASFINDKKGWIASLDKLAGTNDGGINWNDVKLPENIGQIIAIDYRDFGGYLLDNNGAIYMTSGNGQSWEKLNFEINLNDYFVSTSLFQTSAIRFTKKDSGTIVLMQKNPKVSLVTFITEDNGKTWIKNEIKEKISSTNTIFLSRDADFITVKETKDNFYILTVFKKNN